MKTLNVRLVIILVIAAVVLGGGVVGLHFFQMRGNADFFLEQACQAEMRARTCSESEDFEQARTEYEDAVEQYGWFVNLNRENADAWEKLAFLQAGLAQAILETMDPEDSRVVRQKTYGESSRANTWSLASLERVLRLDADRSDSRRKAVNLTLTFRRYSDAIEHLEGFSETLPNDGELMLLLGNCHEKLRRDEEAVTSLSQAIELAPDLLETYLLLARILSSESRLNRPEEADIWMEKMVEANPDSSLAHLSFGRYLMGLAGLNSLDTIRLHPLMLKRIVPSTLGGSVNETIEGLELSEEDPERISLSEKQLVLVDAVKRALSVYDSELPLDDPDTLLMNSISSVKVSAASPEALTKARDETLGALEDELSAEDMATLQLASKHGVLVAAMQSALQNLGDGQFVAESLRDVVLDDVMTHAETARRLAAEDREVLATAQERGVLADAIGRALEKLPASDLRLTANRTEIENALGDAVKGLGLPADDKDARRLAAKHNALVTAVRRALRDSQLVSCNLASIPEGTMDAVLADVVERMVERRSAQLENNDRDALLLVVRYVLFNEEFDRAREIIQQGLELYPTSARMHGMLSRVELQLGDREQAIAALRRGLEAIEDAPDLLWQLATLLIDARDLEEAKQVVDDLAATKTGGTREVPPAAAAANYLKARIAFAERQWREAANGFTEVRSALSDRPRLLAQAEFLTGQCYRRLSNPDKAQLAFERALVVNPRFSQARAALAAVLGRAGQTDQAIDQFRNLGFEGLLNAARIMIAKTLRQDEAQQDWTEVEQTLRRAASMNPESSKVIIMSAEVLASQGRVSRAIQFLERAQERYPEDIRFVLALASLAEKEEDWKQAEVLLDEAKQNFGDTLVLRLARGQYLVRRYKQAAADRMKQLAGNTGHFKEAEQISLVVGLARLARQEEIWQQVELLLQQGDQQLGDHVRLRLARAGYLAARYGAEAAEETAKLAQDADQFEENDQLRLWEGLLSVATQIGDYEQAKELCNSLAEKRPNNLQIISVLFENAFRSKDASGMDEALQKIETIEGQGPHWHFGQAARLSLQVKDADDARLDQALEHLIEAEKERPSWSRIPLLMAGIHDQRGEFAAALKHYLQAIDMGERNPAAIHRAAQFLAQGGRYAEARDTIRKAKVRIPRLDNLDMRLARQVGELEEALQLAEKIVPKSEDYRDHVFLGQLLQAKAREAAGARQVDEARTYLKNAHASLQKAVELADDVPETWVALVQFFGPLKQTEEAQKAVAQAREKLSADVLPLALARCYMAMEQDEQAAAEFAKALQAGPEDLDAIRAAIQFYLRTKDNASARKQINRILSGDLKAPLADQLWARRELARMIARKGDFPSRQKALKLIQENLKLSPTSTSDLNFLAQLQGTSPARLQREAAIKTLQSVNNPTAKQAFRLAQLYHDQGDWQKANDQMLRLLSEHNDQPSYTATYVGWLLDRDELDSADLWIRTLQRSAPNQFGTISLRARWLFGRGRYKEAFDLLRGFVSKSDAQPANEATRMYLVANSLEWYLPKLDDPEQDDLKRQFAMLAETLYRRYVRSNPPQGLYLASFLARRGRLNDALDIMEVMQKSANPGALAQTCRIVLTHSDATKQQIQRGEKIVKAARELHPGSVSLAIVLADTKIAQEQYDEAEQLYREYLQNHKEDTTTMNNLALLLALRGIKLDEALELINQAIELAGPIAGILDSRASVHMARGKPDEALADLKTAINDRATPVRVFHRAQAYLQKGDREAAGKAMQEAIDLGLARDMLQLLELPFHEKLTALIQ